MKKQFFLGSIVLSLALFAQAQNFNLEQLGQLTYDQELSDIWAYSTENSSGLKEYALVGLFNGLSIVDVTVPAEPVELHFIGGAASTWRDMKTYNGFAYVSNETNNGILIVDLTKLPEEAPSQNFTGDDQATFTSAHNVFIDELGILYVIGSNYGNGGCLMYDLNENPLTPNLVGIYDEAYVHDAFARNNILYTAEIGGGIFSVVDVNDKSNPTILGTASTPNNFTHNCWLSDDNTTLFTTDERGGSFIAAYDVSDPSDIKELDRIQSSPGEGVIPHNTHVLNDFLITSYYRDGVTIHDASNPTVMVEVGRYDTAPDLSGGGFNGCWGATPFLPSGNILASDIEQGLFILKPTYKRAAFLTGTVMDANTNELLSGVTVTIVDPEAVATTGIEGNYMAGIAGSSTVEVQFSKPGYEILIQTIELTEAETQTLNVSMIELPSFAINVEVFDKDSGEKIPDAAISIVNDDFLFNEAANDAGILTLDKFYEGTYRVFVGKWGYQTIADTINFNANRNSYSANIVAGYYDDFTLDFGWQVSGDAGTGLWERGEPVGTTFLNSTANPDEDVNTDISNLCYVTGNGGGSVGQDDVDDGNSILTSPVFDLSDMTVPVLNYSRWFFNDGGQGAPPNDMMTISLLNGMDTIVVETLNSDSDGNGSWQAQSFNLNDLDIELTTTMTLVVETGDDVVAGHLVEAAFDHFFIEDDFVGIINHQYTDLLVQLSQNPFTHQIQLNLNDAFQKIDGELTIQFISINGKVLHTDALNGSTYTWGAQVPKGIYQYVIGHSNGLLYTDKIIKM